MAGEQPKLGVILDEHQRRDAIHVAIAPVVAAQILSPGEHVGLIDLSPEGLGERVGRMKPHVGIVDPYLTDPVRPGQRFWLFLYPNTVTSLRHEWTHPAFVEVATTAKAAPSETWLRGYAESLGLSYRDLIDGAKAWVTDRDYLVRGGLLEGVCLNEAFWPHFENVTGITVDENKRQSFFSCSC